MTSTRSRIAVAVLAASLIAVAVQTHRLEKAKDRSAELALAAENRAAASDTTRELVLPDTFGDSVRLFEHKVLQVRQEKDVLSRALGTERIAKAGMAVTIDSLRQAIASRSATTEDSSTRVRRAAFDLRQAPYTVAAAVELPPAPDTGRLAITIALDQIPVVARLSCAPPNSDGIRPASIDATSPPWAAIRFDSVQQSPDLCRSPALESRSSSRLRPAFLVGVGLIAPSQREVQLGAFAGVGLAFGR